jgi:uncharacterized protein YbjQ (UPF0145 family)
VTTVAEVIDEMNRSLARAPTWFHDVFGSGTIWEVVIGNSLQVFGVGLAGWMVAFILEKRHVQSMNRREIPLKDIAINNLKTCHFIEPQAATLLIGSVVVAHDYFRTLIIFFRKLVGGNIRHYERLVDRGRREALIRLKEEADLCGIDRVINVRFTATAISGRFLNAVEMVAYGTGIQSGKRRE